VWSSSHPDHFTPWERDPLTHLVETQSAQSRSGCFGEEKLSCLCWFVWPIAYSQYSVCCPSSCGVILLLQSAPQPLVGFWPAQLSLNILSRKVLTECCCQRHVKPPTWRRTRDLEHSNFRHKTPPASEVTLVNPAVEGETMAENFAKSDDFHVTFGVFYMP
jgi:hypothetical protein